MQRMSFTISKQPVEHHIRIGKMHQDGLNVYLELLDGTRIQEYAHLLKPKEGDGPRVLISLPPGTPLRVVLEAHDDFRVFSSEGVKLVVACGHTKQKPWALHDVQAFYISNEDLKEKAWRIEAFDRCRGHDREDQELFDAPEEIPLTAPVPRGQCALLVTYCPQH